MATPAIDLDTSCTDSLHPGRYATALVAYGEALYRRLITPRGTLRGGEDEANYGIDLPGLIGTIGSATAAAALPGMIRSELAKDERTLDVDVTVQRTVNGPAVTYTIAIRAVSDLGVVTLRLAVSDGSAQLLGLVTE